MSRERMTGSGKEAAIAKAIEALEKMLAVDDGDLADEAAAAQNDDVAKEAEAVKSDDAATIGKPGSADVDAGLAAQADAITKDEHKQVTQSLTTGWTPKDEGDQNAKANANWPLTDAEREMVAARLVKLAKTLLQQ